MRRTVAASILFSASLLAGDARAGATVDLLFVGRNGGPVAPTDTVVALPGDTLRMALRVRNDQSFSMTFFSLSYDLDEGDELDVVSAVEWAGLPFFGPPCSLCFPPASTSTFVGPFRGQMRSTGGLPLPVAGGAFAGGYQVGTVVWNVNAGVNDHGADIISGLPFGTEYGFFDAAFNNVTHSVLFRSATVNFVPEPGTVLLLGLGLLAVALRQRRR